MSNDKKTLNDIKKIGSKMEAAKPSIFLVTSSIPE